MSQLFTLEQALDKTIKVVIILALAMMFHYAGRYIIKKIVKKHNRGSQDGSHLTTILSILNSVWKYLIVLLVCISLLNVFNLGATANSLLAAAGVGGLAIGIGAQDFIKDIVNGFTILLENHFTVGDFIRVGDYEGWVVNMTLRTTHVKGLRNELYLLPNNTVTQVTNYTRFPPIVHAKAFIQDESQTERALSALEKLCGTFTHPYLVGKPNLLGVTNLDAKGVELTVSFAAQAVERDAVAYAGRRAVAAALNEAGISFIYRMQQQKG